MPPFIPSVFTPAQLAEIEALREYLNPPAAQMTQAQQAHLIAATQVARRAAILAANTSEARRRFDEAQALTAAMDAEQYQRALGMFLAIALESGEAGKATLYLFDVDGTLTELRPEVKAARPNSAATPNALGEQTPRAGVVDKLAALKATGARFGLVTNRGGIAWGFNSQAECESFAREAAAMCGIGEAPVYLCPHDAKAQKTLRHWPRFQRQVRRWLRKPVIEPVAELAVVCQCRKPAPGLLVQAMQAAGVGPENTVFVGDMESDKQAAANAGVAFVWAQEFFGGEARKQ